MAPSSIIGSSSLRLYLKMIFVLEADKGLISPEVLISSFIGLHPSHNKRGADCENIVATRTPGAFVFDDFCAVVSVDLTDLSEALRGSVAAVVTGSTTITLWLTIGEVVVSVLKIEQ